MNLVHSRADLVVKKKRRRKTEGIAVLLHEHVASHVAGETGCVIGLGQKKGPYQRKTRYSSGDGLIRRIRARVAAERTGQI